MSISQYRIAKAIDVPPRRINEIVHGKRAITADTALRLSRALGLSDMFFINMQAHYDAEIARRSNRGKSASEPRALVSGAPCQVSLHLESRRYTCRSARRTRAAHPGASLPDRIR